MGRLHQMLFTVHGCQIHSSTDCACAGTSPLGTRFPSPNVRALIPSATSSRSWTHERRLPQPRHFCGPTCWCRVTCFYRSHWNAHGCNTHPFSLRGRPSSSRSLVISIRSSFYRVLASYPPSPWTILLYCRYFKRHILIREVCLDASW